MTWTLGDVSNSQTLTSNDHLYNTHINELRTAVDGISYNVKTYGALGNGITDDTAALQAALDAIGTNGGTILIPDGTYLITSTLLIKTSRTQIQCSGGAIIKCDGSSVTTLIKPNTTGLQLIKVFGGKWLQTNATAQGKAFDFSDAADFVLAPDRIDSFGTAYYMHDTVNTTFYNNFRDTQIFDCNNGFDIGGNPANQNTVVGVRIRPKAGGAGTGISLVNARAWTFVGCDIEPATGTGITGVSVDGTCRNNTFINCYLENNATNITIASGANRTVFIGCNVTSPLTTNITDNGTQTAFIATDDNGAVKNNPGALTGTLVTNDITPRTGSALRTATTNGNTLSLSAFNTSAYVAMVTLTTAASPTMNVGVTGGAAGNKMAFWGSTPIVQPVFATGAAHTVDELITVLQTLGLVRQS